MARKSHLQTKLTTVVLLIVAICVLISTTVSLYRLNIVARERLDAAGVFSAQTLATFSVESILAWDYPALQLSIDHTIEYDPHILAIEIFHKNILVASYYQKTEEEGIEYEAMIVVDKLGEQQELGAIKIILSEKKYHAFYMQQIYSLLLLGIVLGFGDTFLIYLTMSRMVLRPLGRIEKGARIIGEGNLEHHINVKGRDEISRLAQVLNDMTKKIKQSQEEAESYKKHLEERIVELERFRKLIVGRELKMTELKKEVKALKEEIAEQ